MENVIIQTKYGALRGDWDGQVYRFRGIPYGGKCDGKFRFLPPQSPDPWNGVLDCTRNGDYAIQPATGVCASPVMGDYFCGGNPDRFGVHEEKQSENCLNLNVVTPALNDEKRAVLVYFHGGGFVAGNGSIVLGADRFVKDQNVVAVGVNHRLGLLGYLYLDEIDPAFQGSGVAGILDLVLALKWVRDNIASFGGNPDQVTIMGESGGSAKVNCLLQMPEARGLFHQAILESGAFPVGIDPETAKMCAKKILDAVQIKPTDLDKLAEISTSDLLNAAFPYLMLLQPVADGKYLDRAIEGKYLSSEYDASIPILIGASEDECAIDWWEIDVAGCGLKKALCNSAYRPPMGAPIWSMDDPRLDELIEYARTHNPNQDDDEALFWKLSSLTPLGVLGVYHQAIERIDRCAAPTYVYLNRYDIPLAMDESKRYSWHSGDVPLQFGIVKHPCCEDVSQTMMNAWGAFVRNGSPSTDKFPWVAYDNVGQQVMVFDTSSGMENGVLEGWVNVVER